LHQEVFKSIYKTGFTRIRLLENGGTA